MPFVPDSEKDSGFVPDSQAMIGPGDPAKAQGASNYDLALNAVGNAGHGAPEPDYSPLTKAIGMGASHIAGVADPLLRYILPEGTKPADMQRAMDPSGEHAPAYALGQAQGVAGPGIAAAATGGPPVQAAMGAFAASHPNVVRGLSQGVADALGTSAIIKLLGLGKE